MQAAKTETRWKPDAKPEASMNGEDGEGNDRTACCWSVGFTWPFV